MIARFCSVTIGLALARLVDLACQLLDGVPQ